MMRDARVAAPSYAQTGDNYALKCNKTRFFLRSGGDSVGIDLYISKDEAGGLLIEVEEARIRIPRNAATTLGAWLDGKLI